MKILKDAAKFDVLTKPEDVIRDISTAARTCYQSQDKSKPETDERLVRNLMSRQHFAMFEFSHMNVRFSEMSRGFTHEMVRHRMASFAQESTRYVDESNLHVIVPPHKDEKVEIGIEKINENHCDLSLEEMFENYERYYKALRSDGWKPEDARQALPIATRSQIVVGANIREWRHIFLMRCDKFAHWEIRGVMLKLLKWCQENIPVVFEDFKFFVTKDGKEYARPTMSIPRVVEKIEENGDILGIIDSLSDQNKMEIYSHLYFTFKNGK